MDSISGFNASLARTESGGNYGALNSEGYGGKYQWGPGRLADYNKATGQNITFSQFMTSPAIQESAQSWHVSDIDKHLGKYVGTVVNGVPMTLNALRAMAHLGGVGGAEHYVTSGGAYNPSDSNGTSLADYAQIHGGSNAMADAAPMAPQPQAPENALAAPQQPGFNFLNTPLDPQAFMNKRNAFAMQPIYQPGVRA